MGVPLRDRSARVLRMAPPVSKISVLNVRLPLDDRVLVKAVQAGDVTVASSLCDRVGPQVDRTIRRLLGSRDAGRVAMKRQHYAELFRRLMERIRIEPPPRLPSDRRRLVAQLEKALRARARRRRVVRRSLQLAFGAAVAAALALGAGKLGRGQGPLVDTGMAESHRMERALTVIGTSGDDEAAVLVGSNRRSLKAGMDVGVGLTLRAPASGEVRVGTADGTQLTLEARTDLSVIEASET